MPSNFTNFDRNNEVKYGFELTGFKTDFSFINFRGLKIEQIENTTEISVFVRWKRKFGPLVIEPGFRLQYYQSLSEISPEPRLGLKYNITDNLRFKAAGGIYTQNLLSTVNERDVVNLFVGFLSGPEEAVYKPGTTNERVDHRLQKAVHGVAGFEVDIAEKFELNVEGYFKDFTQLFALNRNKTLLTDPNRLYLFHTDESTAYPRFDAFDAAVKKVGKHPILEKTFANFGFNVRVVEIPNTSKFSLG